MKRKGRSFALVGSGLGALFVAAIGFAIFVYFTMIRYERVAAWHVPADATAAAHLDLEKVVLYEPFRKHLLPLIDEVRTSPSAGPRLSRIRQHTGIDLALDIREVAFARGPGRGDWVVIVGGKFPRRDVIAGLSEVLRADGLQTTLSSDETELTLESGVALGQASDGVLIAASSQARLAAALPRSDAPVRLGLAPEAPLSFALIGPVLPELASHPAALAVPALGDLAKIERTSGQLSLGEPLSGEARVELGAPADPGRAAERVRRLISGLTLLVRLSGSDFAGESRILDSAEVTEGTRGAAVRFVWQIPDVDRAAESLARALRVWASGNEPLGPR